MSRKPNLPTESEKEIEKLEKQFDAFDQNIKEMSFDRMNAAKKEDNEPQTKISSMDLEKSKDFYLKPKRSIFSKEKFNEKFREDYNFAKEYVRFIAENKEIIGETINMWTKPFPGLPAEEWEIPTNKPIFGPRYLAEQITKCKYHKFVMQQHQVTGTDGVGQYYGSMVLDTIVNRLDAIPVSERKSIFMGSNAFSK
jgi:hypothetical protein